MASKGLKHREHAFGTLAYAERFSVGFFTPSLSRAHIQSVFGYGAGPRLMFRFRAGTQGLNNESLEGGKG